MNGEEHLFTCKDCGAHDLIVTHRYRRVDYCTSTLPCDCGENPDGLAARKESQFTTDIEEWGILDNEHRWDYEECEESDEKEEEILEEEILCGECLEHYRLSDWVNIDANAEDDESSHDYYVTCYGCKREIEFGWSHPGYGGRIWPAECSGFHPWLSWPDPKYEEAWEKKDWIKPEGDE